jgi:hypothetical protein
MSLAALNTTFEWASEEDPFSPQYDYAKVHGQGTVNLRQEFMPSAEAWNPFEAGLRDVEQRAPRAQNAPARPK